MRLTDAVTTEVIRHALETIAEEMRTALIRTAKSVVARDMLDFSCALFDARGRLLAAAVDIPSLLGIMAPAFQAVKQKWGDDIHPGDVFMSNDPYMGCGHTSDVNIFVPVFDDDQRLVGFSGNVSHHGDWGGRVPGTAAAGNHSIFEEGVRMPGVKLEVDGVVNSAVLDILIANVRHPDQNIGDLRAQIAAARTGERRLLSLAHRYGSETLIRTADALIEHAAQRTREALSDLPDGCYKAEGFLDDDGITPGTPVRLAVEVRLRGDEIVFDLSGCDEQMPGGMNIPTASVRSCVQYALKCLLPPDIPFNEGSLDPVTIVALEGTVVNPRLPAAVSDRHLTNQRLADVLTRAVTQIDESRGSAGWFVGWPVLVLDSRSPKTGEVAVLLANVAGGAGATATHDGADALDVHLANCALISAEVIETNYELRVERYALIQDSGGPGRHRGGLGIRADYRYLSPQPGPFLAEAEQSNPRFAPPGMAGGGCGAVASIEQLCADGEVHVLPAKGQYVARPGDAISMRVGGGGGFGDPLRRDPEAVGRDVLDGRVSPQAARDVYGVSVIVRDDGGVDVKRIMYPT